MNRSRFAAHAQDDTLQTMAAANRYNEWLLSRARPFMGSRVVDAGAGIGTFTDLLARDRDFVVAAEPDADFAQQLRSRFSEYRNVSIVEIPAERLSRAVLPSPVDTIVCLNVLEHIRDHERALRSFYETLEDSGRLLLLVPAHQFLYGSADRGLGHVRRYDYRSLQRLLEAARFHVDTLQFVNPVGAIGWFMSSRVLRTSGVPGTSMRLYDRLVPLLKPLDRLKIPLGLSLWAVARRDPS